MHKFQVAEILRWRTKYHGTKPSQLSAVLIKRLNLRQDHSEYETFKRQGRETREQVWD